MIFYSNVDGEDLDILPGVGVTGDILPAGLHAEELYKIFGKFSYPIK